MKKNLPLLLIIVLACNTLLINCKKDDDITNPSSSNDKPNQIISFAFLAEDNAELDQDYTTNIDEESRLITVTLPKETRLEFLAPKIETTTGSSVFPASKSFQNFVNPVTYEVKSNNDNSNNYTVLVKDSDNENRVLSFDILAKNNTGLDQDLIGQINHQSNTITLAFPEGIDIKSLTPTIGLFDQASKSTPKTNVMQDFTAPLTYTVVAPDGSERVYRVKSSKIIFSENKILIFKFLAKDNPSSGMKKDYNALVDETNKVIRLELPNHIGLLKLKPHIIVSKGASVRHSSGTISSTFILLGEHYDVMSEDGKLQKYMIDIYVPNSLSSDRHALLDFYFANKNKLSDWDIENSSMSQWALGQIVISSTRLPRIDYININLSANQDDSSPLEIPESFGTLNALKSLSFISCNLNYFPESVLRLNSITRLVLFNNSIAALPENITQLSALQFLNIQRNQLEKLPEEIGNITALQLLNLSQNQLKTIPLTLVNLNKLKSLDIRNNTIEKLPKEICELELASFQFDDGVCE